MNNSQDRKWIHRRKVRAVCFVMSKFGITCLLIRITSSTQARTSRKLKLDSIPVRLSQCKLLLLFFFFFSYGLISFFFVRYTCQIVSSPPYRGTMSCVETLAASQLAFGWSFTVVSAGQQHCGSLAPPRSGTRSYHRSTVWFSDCTSPNHGMRPRYT